MQSSRKCQHHQNRRLESNHLHQPKRSIQNWFETSTPSTPSKLSTWIKSLLSHNSAVLYIFSQNNWFKINSKSIRNWFVIDSKTWKHVDLNQTIDTSQNENIDTIDTTSLIKPLTPAKPAKTIDSKRIRNRFEIYSKYDSKSIRNTIRKHPHPKLSTWIKSHRTIEQ